MRFNYLKTCLKTAVLITTVLLLGAGLAVAQQTINLTAAPTTVTLPDGSTVPMWGYFCGAADAVSTATCAALNPLSVSTWSPVVITVPAGQTLQINLTNSLSFAAGGGTNTIPTSLTIVGQLGGGLGTTATSTVSPPHATQGATWPVADASTTNDPAAQGPRVQSFSTEVAAGVTPTSLTWTAPRPGTYLLESGTHPSIQAPMGLYGMLVVTCAPTANAECGTVPAGTAYPAVAATATSAAVPAVAYGGEVPLVFGEIDP